jgi:hypothetical protein
MIKFVASLLLAFSADALHADERGKYDWVQENIGNVVDAVFLGKK